jgi:hypothetical protein
MRVATTIYLHVAVAIFHQDIRLDVVLMELLCALINALLQDDWIYGDI